MADRGAALLLSGEPGIGKTTLLDFAAAAATGRVLRAAAVESESLLPYATLADLLLPIRGLLPHLPAAQRHALTACLALSERPHPADANPYAVCVGTLNLLAAAGEAEPTLVLVDDLHWADPASTRVLLFCARRLSGERVGLVATIRDDQLHVADGIGLPTAHLAGLSVEESAELLLRHGPPVAGTVAADLSSLCGGNPLALLQTAAALTPAQLRGQRPVTTPKLGGRLETAWSVQLRELPEATRLALVVMAVNGSGPLSELSAALDRLGLPLETLTPAEQAGLLTSTEHGYDFSHSVLRPLILSQAGLATRLSAHRAMVQVTTGARRAWHLAAAATGPDDAAADALADAARDAHRRGAYTTAARAWHRAAQLTCAPAARLEHLRSAATDAFLGGSTIEAVDWCDEALVAATVPETRADLELLRGRIRTWTGHAADTWHRLAQAADTIRDHDPTRAAVLLAEASTVATVTGDIPAALRTAYDGVILAAADPSSTWVCSTAYALALALAGKVAEVRSHLDAVADRLEPPVPVTDLPVHATAAWCYLHIEEHDRAARVIGTALDTARRSGTPAALPLMLVIRSEVDTWSGRWAHAHSDAVEALRWAEELGQPSSIALSLVHQARIDAARGERARCEELVAASRARIGPYGMGALETYHTSALGLAALSRGDHSAAVDHLEAALEHANRQGLGNPVVVPFAGDLVEAHLHDGNRRRAADVLALVQAQANTTGLAWPAAVAARYRGALADNLDEAAAAFTAAAAAHRRVTMPFEQARTLLCEGETLRRLHHPAAARRPLTCAIGIFQSLGARPWAARAAAELAAAGQRPAAHLATGALDLLTAQELQIARAIADGLSNAEAAATLFLSRKTVEAHLTRVYRKLGLRSRTDLARVLASEHLTDP